MGSDVFSRDTILAATTLLRNQSHADLDRLLLEIGFEESVGRGTSLKTRSNDIAQHLLAASDPRPQVAGSTDKIVAAAAKIYNRSGRALSPNVTRDDVNRFRDELRKDGFIIDQGNLRRTASAVVRADNPAERYFNKPVIPDKRSSETKLSTRAVDVTHRNRVFIVHGHDENAKLKVARFLEKADIEAIILSERPSGGKAVIEKIEAYADVDFAVVILTPDDVGGPNDGELSPRARQNVLLELGYFMAKLGRSKVYTLKKGQVDIPSDFAGVIWEELDDRGAWQISLRKELKHAGFKANWDRAFD